MKLGYRGSWNIRMWFYLFVFVSSFFISFCSFFIFFVLSGILVSSFFCIYLRSLFLLFFVVIVIKFCIVFWGSLVKLVRLMAVIFGNLSVVFKRCKMCFFCLFFFIFFFMFFLWLWVRICFSVFMIFGIILRFVFLIIVLNFFFKCFVILRM